MLTPATLTEKLSRNSRLGLGLAALGRPGYINLGHAADLDAAYEPTAMEARAHAVLDAAYDLGIRYFDAARSYGRAEAFLGSWLRGRELPLDAVIVGSKWGYTYTADWQVEAAVHEVKEHSAVVLRRQWGESRAELGDHLALYQIHSATLESGVLDNAAVLRELSQIRAASGIALGLSVSGPHQHATIERALAITVDGEPLFSSVQATWNLLERSAEGALAAAAAAGWVVIVKEALANGRLTPRNPDPAFAEQLVRLMEQAERLSCTVDALALAAVLARPWAGMVLSGAARVEHVQANRRALDVVWDGQAEAALADLVESAELYWRRRSALAWN